MLSIPRILGILVFVIVVCYFLALVQSHLFSEKLRENGPSSVVVRIYPEGEKPNTFTVRKAKPVDPSIIKVETFDTNQLVQKIRAPPACSDKNCSLHEDWTMSKSRTKKKRGKKSNRNSTSKKKRNNSPKKSNPKKKRNNSPKKKRNNNSEKAVDPTINGTPTTKPSQPSQPIVPGDPNANSDISDNIPSDGDYRSDDSQTEGFVGSRGITDSYLHEYSSNYQGVEQAFQRAGATEIPGFNHESYAH